MNFNRKNFFSIVIAVLLVLPSLSLAHHSTAGFFDRNTKVEIAGVITDIRWRNPHTVFELDVKNEDGSVTAWSVESGALSVLRAQGLTNAVIDVGDFVKILGDKSLQNRPETFARSMLVPSGEEVLLTLGAQKYFSSASDVSLMRGGFDEVQVAEARRNAEGIFRVWSRINEDASFLRPIFETNETARFPYTEHGKIVLSSWDASAESILGCTEWNMPRLMGNPLPMEFVYEGENILIRFEENDSRRTVYMNADTDSAPDEHSLMGYSIGHWEEDTLVIQTSHILENAYEMPVSNQITLEEKFTAIEDGTVLNYEIVITDPVMLTEPVIKTSTWNWRPEIEVNSYSCEV